MPRRERNDLIAPADKKSACADNERTGPLPHKARKCRVDITSLRGYLGHVLHPKSSQEKPGSLNYGSPSGGENIAVFTSMFQNLADIKMTEIPYRGVVPMLTDAIAGRIQVMFADYASSRGFIAEGKLRALGVSTRQRFKGTPDIPTIAESGVPGFDASAWQMLVAPAKTPKEVVALLNSNINAIVKSPEISDAITKFGLMPDGNGTPDELLKYCQIEVTRWGDVLRQAGIADTQ